MKDDKFEPPTRAINVVYLHARLIPVRARVFINWFRQELREFRA